MGTPLRTACRSSGRRGSRRCGPRRSAGRSARVSGSARAATPERGSPAAIGARRSSQSRQQLVATPPGARAGRRGRPPGRARSSASGIRSASRRALEIGAIASRSPCMTSVGAWMQSQPRHGVVVDGRPQVRPDALRRRAVAGEVAQQLAHPLGLLAPELVGEQPLPQPGARRLPRRPPAAPPASAPSSPSAGRAARGPPGVVPPSTSPRTRSGKRIASSWAIMPPIESPHTCALSTPELAQQPGRVGGQLGHRRRPQRRRRAARRRGCRRGCTRSAPP